jgi:hypothetical protein
MLFQYAIELGINAVHIMLDVRDGLLRPLWAGRAADAVMKWKNKMTKHKSRALQNHSECFGCKAGLVCCNGFPITWEIARYLASRHPIKRITNAPAITIQQSAYNIGPRCSPNLFSFWWNAMPHTVFYLIVHSLLNHFMWLSGCNISVRRIHSNLGRPV